MSQSTPTTDFRIHAGQPPIAALRRRKLMARRSESASDPTDADSRRIDRSHLPGDHGMPKNQSLARRAEQKNSDEDREISRESWLKLHAADLIQKLQVWSNDLDVREATLHVGYAKQDLRERQFRLQRQEIEAEILCQQLAADELEYQLKQQARRLAFQSVL